MTNAELPYGPAATEPTPEPAASIDTAPPSPARARRGLGVASLVLSLIPYLLVVVTFIATIVAGVMDTTGWAALGYLIIGLLITGWSGILLGLIAIGLGIAAIKRHRGRGQGIAGIVLGGLAILLAIPTLPNLFYTF